MQLFSSHTWRSRTTVLLALALVLFVAGSQGMSRYLSQLGPTPPLTGGPIASANASVMTLDPGSGAASTVAPSPCNKNGICDPGETRETCSAECGITTASSTGNFTCNNDGICQDYEWEEVCPNDCGNNDSSDSICVADGAVCGEGATCCGEGMECVEYQSGDPQSYATPLASMLWGAVTGGGLGGGGIRTCQVPSVCGNGTLEPTLNDNDQLVEQCDDGNRVAGDGCDANCQSEGDKFYCVVRSKRAQVPWDGRVCTDKGFCTDWGTAFNGGSNGEPSQKWQDSDFECGGLGNPPCPPQPPACNLACRCNEQCMKDKRSVCITWIPFDPPAGREGEVWGNCGSYALRPGAATSGCQPNSASCVMPGCLSTCKVPVRPAICNTPDRPLDGTCSRIYCDGAETPPDVTEWQWSCGKWETVCRATANPPFKAGNTDEPGTLYPGSGEYGTMAACADFCSPQGVIFGGGGGGGGPGGGGGGGGGLLAGGGNLAGGGGGGGNKGGGGGGTDDGGGNGNNNNNGSAKSASSKSGSGNNAGSSAHSGGTSSQGSGTSAHSASARSSVRSVTSQGSSRVSASSTVSNRSISSNGSLGTSSRASSLRSTASTAISNGSNRSAASNGSMRSNASQGWSAGISSARTSNTSQRNSLGSNASVSSGPRPFGSSAFNGSAGSKTSFGGQSSNANPFPQTFIPGAVLTQVVTNGQITLTSVIPAPSPLCGNNFLDAGEECDDGNQQDLDGCSAYCLLERGSCGDGVIQSLLGEQCEPSVTSLIPCNLGCRYQLVSCGDGYIQPGEGCDDAIANSNLPGARCRPDCSLARCGDSIQDRTEACDDGNRLPGDGCDAFCRSERAAAQQQQTNGTLPAQVIDVPFQQGAPQQQPVYSNQLPAQVYQQPGKGVTSAPQTTESGPGAIAMMAAGAAAGYAWIRRRR